jgi:hypothetical protein
MSNIATIIVAVGGAITVICVIAPERPLRTTRSQFAAHFTPLDTRRHRRQLRRLGLDHFDDRVELRVSRHRPHPRYHSDTPMQTWVGVFNRSTDSVVGCAGRGRTVADALASLVASAEPRQLDKYRAPSR